jgi:O-antigen ligase
MISNRAEGAPARIMTLCFGAFLLVVLNFVIDAHAMDISLIPRLLALQLFLMFGVVLVGWTRWSGPLDAGLLRDPLILCYAGYTLLTIVSPFHGANPTAGFTEAAKTFAVLVTLVLACLLLPRYGDWPRLLMKCAVVAGLLGLAAGLYDWLTGPGWGLHPRDNMLAVKGLMSNVNLYASFLLLVLPWCAAGVFALRGPWRYASAASAGLLLVMTLFLQTRAVYLGLAAAAVVVAAALPIVRARLGGAQRARRRQLAWALLPLLGAVLFVLATPWGQPVADRMASIFTDHRMTAAGGRPVIWLASLGMIRDHFFTGVGAGNFPVRLHDYFDIDDPEFSTVHPNWLQPHNDFLWVFAEKGVVAFLLFAAVWWLAFRHLVRAMRERPVSIEPAFLLATLAGLAAHLVVSLFDFPMERVNHQVWFAFYLAAAVLANPAARRARATSPVPSGRWRLVSSVIAALLAVSVFYSLYALRQERFVLHSRSAFAEGDWRQTLQYAQAASTGWKTLDPFAVPVAYLEGMGHLMLARHREALACFQRARAEMPSRAYIIKSLALAHGMLGNYEESLACHAEVLRRSPGHVETLQSLASTHLRARQPRRAIEVLQSIPPDQWTEAVSSTMVRAKRMLKDGP